MASAATLRSAARSLRLQQPLLEQPGGLLARRAIAEDLSPATRRLLSSSVPTERSRGTTEQKGPPNKKTEDIYQRISTKIDMISDGLDKQTRLLKEIEASGSDRPYTMDRVDTCFVPSVHPL